MNEYIFNAYSSDALGYYAVLRLTADADTAKIKQNYRDLAKVWHPDYNKDPQALEVFQKLSVAYEVLNDDKKRLIYDLLSTVYTSENYPDLETIKPFKAPGAETANIRMISLSKVRGLLWKSRQTVEKLYCTYNQAFNHEFKTSLSNWILGWWSPSAFIKNIKALRSNFSGVDDCEANLRLLIHNAVAYYYEKRPEIALQSAYLAKSYANQTQKQYLQDFISLLHFKVKRPKRWNFRALQAIQLVFPALLVFFIVISPSLQYLGGMDLLSYFRGKEEITYFQEVNFGARGRSVDDVVVGKIMNIPVDRSDMSRLYHFKDNGVLMYGPSDDFDVMKKLKAGTTVRLTGLTPDNTWARVMIDNGEMGFIRLEFLEKGIGKKIPEYSKVYCGNE